MSRSGAGEGAHSRAKQQYLKAYEREHDITMRVLRAFPTDRLDLRPHQRLKTARELAWVFVMERMLGTSVFHNALASGQMSGSPPAAPESWDTILSELERVHREFGDLVRGTPDDELDTRVKFFVAPRTLGDVTRMENLWFLLHDQIHHRGQLSIYLRMADAKVPSIYGPTADEPWM
jgi:uncharacterized damage-inducible protein DinB